MTRLKVGGLYFLIVFSIAFAFGTLRVLFLAPMLGEIWAVLFEVSILVILSWMISSRLLKKFDLQSDCLGAIIVGASAFLLLMFIELSISVFAFGRSSTEYFGSLRVAPGVIGLLGQVFFGLIPFLQVASADGDCKEFLRRSESKQV